MKTVETDIPKLESGHVGLNVTHLSRSKHFYQEVFGLDVVSESQEAQREFAFLGKDGKLFLTLWQQGEGRFGKGHPGLHHLSFQVSSIDAVKQAERKLRAIGARLIYDGIVAHAEGAESGGIYFEDPDGIRLEIYAPTGAEAAHAPTHGAPSCGFF